MYILVIICGLVVGSFLAAYTYRAPKDISIKHGRSFCPKCKKKISWHDNIPLFSFIILKGKCRNCKKKISFRYPLIEFSTALVFLTVYVLLNNCAQPDWTNQAGLGATISQGVPLYASGLCNLQTTLGQWALPYLLFVSAVFVAIFVIDFEHQIIVDELILSLFAISFLVILLSFPPTFYVRLLTGFAASLFLLLIHLATFGRGMGLGDVKLAIPAALILGWPSSLAWMFLSFVLGAIVGVLLILLKKAKFGKHIAFGPFMVISFFIALFWGDWLIGYIFPYLRL